jgi:hypothetical protein
MEEDSAAHMEAAAVTAGGEAVTATAASVMAAWASTDLVFSVGPVFRCPSALLPDVSVGRQSLLLCK